MMRLRIGLFSACTLAASGCFAGPSAQEVQQLQMRLASIEQRISLLERARGRRAETSTSLSASTAADTAFAQEGTSTFRDESAGSSGSAADAFTKFFRGGVNLLTGWVEIPKRIQQTTQRSGVGAGLTLGLLRGLGYGFIRTAGGLYELVTFPVPAPPGYKPVMQPPFVFQSDLDTP